MARLYIQGLRRITNMSDHGSICLHMPEHLNMPQYVLTYLDKPEHGLIFLNVPECMNIPEYSWINCSDYARVLNVLQYSYNNIIFVTKFIRLEFWSVTILSLFTTSWNIGIMKASKLLISIFFFTKMTPELLQYSNEELGVFLNVK